MNITANVKNYFKAKSENKETGKAPEGICPNCWGKQEWDGEFYRKIKGKSTNQKSDIYNNFIKEVVGKLDKITLQKDTYFCETCNMKYDK